MRRGRQVLERKPLRHPSRNAFQAEIASLHTALGDVDLYSRDPRAFATQTARLTAAQAELEAAETEWLELEMMREELGG